MSFQIIFFDPFQIHSHSLPLHNVGRSRIDLSDATISITWLDFKKNDFQWQCISMREVLVIDGNLYQ